MKFHSFKLDSALDFDDRFETYISEY